MPLVVFLHHSGGDVVYVADSLPKGGLLDSHHGQTVVEILPETSFVDGTAEVLVGRCQEPHLNGDLLIPAKAAKTTRLQNV